MCLLQTPGYSKRNKREPLSYWVGVQVYQSLYWLHRSYNRFCPPTVSDVSHYNLRDSSNITMPVTRTATVKRSCIPAFVDLWKNLDPTIRQKPTLSSFSNALRSQVRSNIVPIYYIQGNRKLSVIHARLRNHCSNLIT